MRQTAPHRGDVAVPQVCSPRNELEIDLQIIALVCAMFTVGSQSSGSSRDEQNVKTSVISLRCKPIDQKSCRQLANWGRLANRPPNLRWTLPDACRLSVAQRLPPPFASPSFRARDASRKNSGSRLPQDRTSDGEVAGPHEECKRVQVPQPPQMLWLQVSSPAAAFPAHTLIRGALASTPL